VTASLPFPLEQLEVGGPLEAHFSRNTTLREQALNVSFRQELTFNLRHRNDTFVPDPDLKGEGHAKVTAQHVHPLSPSLAHHALNRGADLLGGVQHMLIIEVRIARRRLRRGMAKQTSDHGEGLLIHSGMAGEGVPEIVNSHAVQTRFAPDDIPMVVDGPEAPPETLIPEHPGHLLSPGLRIDHCPRLIAQPDGARPGLAVPQLQSVPAHILPLQAENLPAPATSEDQQRERTRSCGARLIRPGAMPGQHRAQPGKLRIAEEPLTDFPTISAY
jgi:hypothetical protein